MKRLIKEQLKDFNIIISQKLHCRCRKFNELLIAGNATNQDLLEIEIFLKLKCSEFYMLTCLYEDQCIQNFNAKKIIDDPTTQE